MTRSVALSVVEKNGRYNSGRGVLRDFEPCKVGQHETEGAQAQRVRTTGSKQRTKSRESRDERQWTAVVNADRATRTRTEAEMVSNTDERQASKWPLRRD